MSSFGLRLSLYFFHCYSYFSLKEYTLDLLQIANVDLATLRDGGEVITSRQVWLNTMELKLIPHITSTIQHC